MSYMPHPLDKKLFFIRKEQNVIYCADRLANQGLTDEQFIERTAHLNFTGAKVLAFLRTLTGNASATRFETGWEISLMGAPTEATIYVKDKLVPACMIKSNALDKGGLKKACDLIQPALQSVLALMADQG